MSRRPLPDSGAARQLRRSASQVHGFTLIELMVAMLLGLIVIAGVVSVFLAGQQSYRTNVALGDVQDSSRIAFELMAHDIRDAGLTGCNNNPKVANTLKNGPYNAGSTWWANWNNAIHGYGIGTVTDPAPSTAATYAQISGTDSLMLMSTADLGLTVNANVDATHFTTNATVKTTLKAGDVAVVCDPVQATIFQVTSNAANSVEHAASGTSPGNCTQGLGYHRALVCTNTVYDYGANAQVARLTAVDWYVGVNTATGITSLYRVNLESGGTTTTAEMVRDVAAMNLTYHQAPKAPFVEAKFITDWSVVDAVKVELTVESTNKRAGTDVKPISRSFTAITTLRNRVN